MFVLKGVYQSLQYYASQVNESVNRNLTPQQRFVGGVALGILGLAGWLYAVSKLHFWLNRSVAPASPMQLSIPKVTQVQQNTLKNLAPENQTEVSIPQKEVHKSLTQTSSEGVKKSSQLIAPTNNAMEATALDIEEIDSDSDDEEDNEKKVAKTETKTNRPESPALKPKPLRIDYDLEDIDFNTQFIGDDLEIVKFEGVCYWWGDFEFDPRDIKNFSGKGRYQDEKGIVYEGLFINGNLEGWGKKIYDQRNNVLVGEFKSNYLNGKGKISYYGELYEGECKMDHLHGYGKKTLRDGTVFEGQFIKDRLNGEGKITHKNNYILEGSFFEDRLHGQGKIIYPNGVVREGTFSNNQLVNTPPLNNHLLEKLPDDLARLLLQKIPNVRNQPSPVNIR